jgi:hypothetical protein
MWYRAGSVCHKWHCLCSCVVTVSGSALLLLAVQSQLAFVMEVHYVVVGRDFTCPWCQVVCPAVVEPLRA